MDFRDALKWGLYDRVLAFVSLAVGLGIAVGALWIGTGEWFVQALQGDPGGGPQGGDLAIALGGIVLGLFVWQLGKTAARHRTVVSATEQRVHRRLAGHETGDAEERLAQIESDLAEVRRMTARLEQAAGLEDAGGGSAGAGGAGAGAGGAAASGAGTADAADAGAPADDAAAAQSAAAGAGADTTGEAGGGGTTSTADGGTADDDAFEWAEEDEDGEYYRDA